MLVPLDEIYQKKKKKKKRPIPISLTEQSTSLPRKKKNSQKVSNTRYFLIIEQSSFSGGGAKIVQGFQGNLTYGFL